MRDRIFFDTNILVYLTDEKAEFHRSVSDVFEDIARIYDIWISRQVLREYAIVVSRKEFVEKPLRPDQIINDIARWEKIFGVIDETRGVTEHLKSLIFEYNLKGKIIHDANIVATMIKCSIPLLFTYNIKDFKIFKEIELLKIEDKSVSARY